jgi:hypothetical protein
MQREYFKQGKLDQFRQILEEGSSHGNSYCSEILFFIYFCFPNRKKKKNDSGDEELTEIIS